MDNINSLMGRTVNGLVDYLTQHRYEIQVVRKIGGFIGRFSSYDAMLAEAARLEQLGPDCKLYHLLSVRSVFGIVAFANEIPKPSDLSGRVAPTSSKVDPSDMTDVYKPYGLFLTPKYLHSRQIRAWRRI